MVKTCGVPTTSWLQLIADGKYYIPSCDFSCMISTEMFEEFFLEGIIEECRFSTGQYTTWTGRAPSGILM